MQFYMRRWSVLDIAPGTDEVLCAWPIPADCNLNQVHAEIHASASAAIAVTNGLMLGVEGWILQSETSADYETMDTLWDKFVPKEDDPTQLDPNVTADTDTFMEPGSVNMNQVMEQEIAGPERFYKYTHMMTIANMRQAAFVEATQLFIPSDVIKIQSNKNYRVDDDSGALIAFSSPDVAALGTANNDVIVTVAGNARSSFFTLAHLEDFVHLAMINMTNMTQAGAEEPYENLFAFIEESLEQVQGVGATAIWTSLTFNVWTRAIAGIRTLKQMNIQTLGPDAQAS